MYVELGEIDDDDDGRVLRNKSQPPVPTAQIPGAPGLSVLST